MIDASRFTFAAAAFACTAALLAGPSTASATVIDFDDNSLAGWQTTAGDVSINTDQARSGVNSLFVAGGQSAAFRFGDNSHGTLTMWVYDPGNVVTEGDGNGPSWGAIRDGVVDDRPGANRDLGDHGARPGVLGSYNDGEGGEAVAAYFLRRDGYAPETEFVNYHATGTNDHFTFRHFGGRQMEQWSLWTFEFLSDDEFRIMHGTESNPAQYRSGVLNEEDLASMLGHGISGIYLHGGSGDLGDIYIDDVSWTPVPEPATLGLLGLGGLALLGRRRRTIA